MHPTDYPQQIHVNEILNNNNYFDLPREMKDFLLAKDKSGFIDGTLIKPTQDGLEIKEWECYDP